MERLTSEETSGALRRLSAADFGFIDCATVRNSTISSYEAFPRFVDRCGFSERARGYGV